MDGVDGKSGVGPREEVRWNVKAFFVLDDEIRVQCQLLEFRQSLVGWKVSARLKQLVISEENELMTS